LSKEGGIRNEEIGKKGRKDDEPEAGLYVLRVGSGAGGRYRIEEFGEYFTWGKCQFPRLELNRRRQKTGQIKELNVLMRN
jgi:hypothetical protein